MKKFNITSKGFSLSYLKEKITINDFMNTHKKMFRNLNLVRVIFYSYCEEKKKLRYDSEILTNSIYDIYKYKDVLVLSYRLLCQKSYLINVKDDVSIILYVYGSRYEIFNPEIECDNPTEDYEDLFNMFND